MEDVCVVLLLLVGVIVLSVLMWFLFNYRKIIGQSKEELNKTKAAYDKMAEKYQPVMDVDKEVLKRRQQVLESENKIKVLNDTYVITSQSMNAQYKQSKQLYDSLKKELSLLEETLDIQAFGLYKPHYDYSSSEQYKTALERNYENQKAVIKAGRAAICATTWRVSDSKREGEKMVNQNLRLFLRAFNGECDSAIAKVKWNNVVVMEERIRKTYETINKFGTTLQVSITAEYLNYKLEELRLVYEYEEQLHKEKEEQRRIQEQIREEEKAQRELEKAKLQSEEEEKRYQKALEKARIEMETAKGKELTSLNTKVAELEKRLKEAQENQRTISQAQITKAGHVYVISNIGSFGENVFKIGMTRRLEPEDRIKELGDASVPFQFDIHAMIESDNAPELERKLHEHFENGQINLINDRKEFYVTSIDEIEKFCLANNLKCTIIKVPEAKEYRESIAMKKQREKQTQIEDVVPEPDNKFPDSLVQK